VQSLLNRVWIALFLFLGCPGQAADTLDWRMDRVSADIRSTSLPDLLKQVSAASGWKIYLEPGTHQPVSAKFKDLPPGDALRHLLGNLNFALVPRTNENPRLYVFRTTRENATQLIESSGSKHSANRQSQTIPNELIVRLKPGANIDDIARALGAKVTGRIPGLNAYRLQFTDAASADAARQELAGDSNVTSVDSNYAVDPPPTAIPLASAGLPPIQLQLNPPDSNGKVIVGLIDTAVQPLGNDLDKFLLKSISVAGDANPEPGLPAHGTSMFENILRSISSVSGGNSSVQVISVDVYGPNTTSSTFDVAQGIVQAVNNGANVINLSLGSPGGSPLLESVIQQVKQHGDVVVAAAGNDGSPEMYYPAAYPGVLSVAASSAPGQLAPYSNYGPFIDLMAPGNGIVYFNDQAWLVTGTSASSAYVTGVVAGTANSQRLSVADAGQLISSSSSLQFVRPN